MCCLNEKLNDLIFKNVIFNDFFDQIHHPLKCSTKHQNRYQDVANVLRFPKMYSLYVL